MRARKIHESLNFVEDGDPYTMLGIGKNVIKNKIISGELTFGDIKWNYNIKILTEIICTYPEDSGYTDFFTGKGHYDDEILVASPGDNFEYHWDGYDEIFGSLNFDDKMNDSWGDQMAMPPGIDANYFIDNPESWEFTGDVKLT